MSWRLCLIAAGCAITAQMAQAGPYSVSSMGRSVGGNIFATPLPHGPGSVAMPIPHAPMKAPVLMPIGAPTAAPVGVYQYPQPFGPSDITAFDPSCAEPCPPGEFYGSADFLYGATQGVYLPPLITASPAGTAPANVGGLFSPTTITQFGTQRAGNNFRPGMRLNLGYMFGPDQHHGVDASFFFLGRVAEQYTGAAAPGSPIILARPAVNGLTNENIGFPFGTVGPAGVTGSFSTSFIGYDINYRKRIACDGRFDLLLGYRYAHLGDAVQVFSSQGGTLPNMPPLAITDDRIATRNNFHGPQIGFSSRIPLNARFSLDLMSKLAMGVTVANADLTGSTTTPQMIVPTGLLVEPTNAGNYTSHRFAVVPEVGAKLGYQLCDGLDLTFGYSLIYWSSVQRAPEQIDLTVLAPGRPAFPNRSTDVWMQGITAGLQWRY